ncbi:MAG TPA: hypothetical protein VL443_19970 [Cyclobacteriaceae bacterium]|jgi:hypothetical protein|nr:hypothetical protein [Cyclobacteriaceae bacterium]
MIEIDQSIKTTLKDVVTDNNSQRLTILTNDGLRIVIIIPHNVFEWFIDVFDSQNKKVHTNWTDHYGDTEKNLKIEMKKSVEGFIQTVTRYPVRIVMHDKSNRSILQVCKDEVWTDNIY